MLTPKTVLVMDSDQDLRLALQNLLERSGYRVLLAEDGEQGLATARAEQPDLVILDMLLPRLNGFAVLECLKAARPQTLVIMAAANTSEQHQELARFLGADDFLSKPLPHARLLASAQRLCPTPRQEPAAVS